MASVDFQDPGVRGVRGFSVPRSRLPVRPRTDALGRALFAFHVLVGAYLCFGWLVPAAFALAFYMVVLPVVAVQWLLNKGSCVLNNFESWLRHGRWRDPRNAEEASWLAMLAHWLFRWTPSRATLDTLSYATVAGLWVLAFAHFSVLPAN